jgi:hypothetical protein
MRLNAATKREASLVPGIVLEALLISEWILDDGPATRGGVL